LENLLHIAARHRDRENALRLINAFWHTLNFRDRGLRIITLILFYVGFVLLIIPSAWTVLQVTAYTIRTFL
jgi:hypothetical protein